MKKLLILTTATFIVAASVNAQVSDALVKNEIKTIRKQELEIKKEKKEDRKEQKEDRKELRKLEGNEVSYQAKQQFRIDFGNIPVTKWHRSTNFDEATFTKDGKVTTAFYDDQANLVGTTSDRTVADIPGKARRIIHKKYPGYKITHVVFFDDNEANENDMMMYDVQFDDEDSYMVELQKGNDNIVLKVNKAGDTSYFTKIRKA